LLEDAPDSSKLDQACTQTSNESSSLKVPPELRRCIFFILLLSSLTKTTLLGENVFRGIDFALKFAELFRGKAHVIREVSTFLFSIAFAIPLR
jgi:hypothetical protein